MTKGQYVDTRCHNCGGDDLAFTDSNPPGMTRVECIECEATEIVDANCASVGTTSPDLRRRVEAISEDAERDI
jgi:ribosomal protein S27E